MEFSFDETLPQDQRVHTPLAVIPCVAHAGIPSVAATHVAVIAENKLKNDSIGAIKKDDPTILEDDIKFSFDASRKLTLTLPTKYKTNLNKWKTLLDSTVGAGKVTLK